MKPLYKLVDAVHKQMAERTILQVLISKSLCNQLEVVLNIIIQIQTEDCTTISFCNALNKLRIHPVLLDKDEIV